MNIDRELEAVRQHALLTRNNGEQQVPDTVHRTPNGYIVHFIGKDQQASEIVTYDRALNIITVIGFVTRKPESDLTGLRKDNEILFGVGLWALLLLSSAIIGYCWVMYNAWGKR